jgi:hypothetical protein
MRAAAAAIHHLSVLALTLICNEYLPAVAFPSPGFRRTEPCSLIQPQLLNDTSLLLREFGEIR